MREVPTGTVLTTTRLAARLLLPILAVGLAPAAHAQASAVHRTVLLDVPFPPPTYHTVTTKVVVDPGGEIMPHTHPGVEVAYIMTGRAIVTIKGQPGRTLSAGDSFSTSPGMIHSAKNVGTGPLIMISTYVIERGQPLVSPAP